MKKVFLSTKDKQAFYSHLGYSECTPPTFHKQGNLLELLAKRTLEALEDKKAMEEEEEEEEKSNKKDNEERQIHTEVEPTKDYPVQTNENKNPFGLPPPPPPILPVLQSNSTRVEKNLQKSSRNIIQPTWMSKDL